MKRFFFVLLKTGNFWSFNASLKKKNEKENFQTILDKIFVDF